MSWLDAIILGLVEGITEFLPISSTGHLILTRAFLGLSKEDTSVALIVIQGAAILAVCWEYRVKLWNTLLSLFTDPNARRFALNVLIAFIPIAVIGLKFKDASRTLLFKPIPVAMALFIGGFIILWPRARKHVEDHSHRGCHPAEGCGEGGAHPGARAHSGHQPLGRHDPGRPLHRHGPARGDGVFVFHRDSGASRSGRPTSCGRPVTRSRWIRRGRSG